MWSTEYFSLRSSHLSPLFIPIATLLNQSPIWAAAAAFLLAPCLHSSPPAVLRGAENRVRRTKDTSWTHRRRRRGRRAGKSPSPRWEEATSHVTESHIKEPTGSFRRNQESHVTETTGRFRRNQERVTSRSPRGGLGETRRVTSRSPQVSLGKA